MALIPLDKSRKHDIIISGGDFLGKKALSNVVDEDILSQFKAACALNKKPMSAVLEELLKSYIEETEARKKNPE